MLVVGGGITGSATAYRLAQAGADVVLVERYDLNTQGSGSNAGSLHSQLQHEPFMHRGEAWARAYAPATALPRRVDELWQTLGDELGSDLEVAILGGILVAETEAQLRDVERKVRIEREQGLDVELLAASDLQRIAPYVSDAMVGGELCRGEGKANPLLAGPAFARAAQAAGARLLLHTELHALERDEHGFVAQTGAGPIAARRVVSCGGVEAGHVTQLLGVPLPVEGHAIQLGVTEPVAPLVRHLLYFAGDMLTLKQARVGSLLIGGGWPARLAPDGTPTVDPRLAAREPRGRPARRARARRGAAPAHVGGARERRRGLAADHRRARARARAVRRRVPVDGLHGGPADGPGAGRPRARALRARPRALLADPVLGGAAQTAPAARACLRR